MEAVVETDLAVEDWDLGEAAEEVEMGLEEAEMGWEEEAEEAEMGWEVEVALVVVAWAKEEMVRFDKESTSCMDFLKDLQGNLANSSFHSVSACIR